MGVILAILVLAGLAFIAVGVLGLFERLPPNSIIGIRTTYTRASRENWYAVHRAGSPWMIFGGVAIAAAGLACLPFVFANAFSYAASLAVVIVLLVLLLLTGLGGWVFGVWGARHGILSTGFPQQDDR